MEAVSVAGFFFATRGVLWLILTQLFDVKTALFHAPKMAE